MSKSHGMCRTPEYNSWMCMRNRCRHPNNPSWQNYGGRGITVCKRWNKFENFYQDMGPRPTRFHTIERVDNNSGYRPSNCIWATMTEQSRNSTRNRVIEMDGKRQCLTDWCKELGFDPMVVHQRIVKLGWNPIVALTTPVTQLGKYIRKPDDYKKHLHDPKTGRFIKTH